MTTTLQSAIDEAIARGNITLILTALRETQLYTVCTQQDSESVIWFVSSQEDENVAVITVSENVQWLEDAFAGSAARDKMFFKPIAGADVAAMGIADAVEVYVQFEGDRAYKIPRSNFAYWAARGL